MIGNTADHRPRPRLAQSGDLGKVVIVDDATGNVAALRNAARAMAPFPTAFNNYPGVRRVVTESNDEAWGLMQQLARTAAPYIGGAFDGISFELVEASFSIVTTPAAALTPPQRAPHFDSTDPNLLALLYFINPAPGSATAFFRHRATGVERIEDNNVSAFVGAALQESRSTRGYVQGSNEHFEELARFEAVPDRMLIYQGALLHSGIIPPEANLSGDPEMGRLTANLFIKVRR